MEITGKWTEIFFRDGETPNLKPTLFMFLVNEMDLLELDRVINKFYVAKTHTVIYRWDLVSDKWFQLY